MDQGPKSESYYNEFRKQLEDKAILEYPNEDLVERADRITEAVESQKRIDKREYDERMEVLRIEQEREDEKRLAKLEQERLEKERLEKERQAVEAPKATEVVKNTTVQEEDPSKAEKDPADKSNSPPKISKFKNLSFSVASLFNRKSATSINRKASKTQTQNTNEQETTAPPQEEPSTPQNSEYRSINEDPIVTKASDKTETDAPTKILHRTIPPGDLDFSVETLNQRNYEDSHHQHQNPATIWQHVQEETPNWSQQRKWSAISDQTSSPPIFESQTKQSQTELPQSQGNVENSPKEKLASDCQKKFKKIKFEIESQNLLVEKLKMILQEKMTISPRTCIDEKNICSIKNCIDNEIKNLQKMIKLSFEEQEACKYSNNDWGHIPLTIALDGVSQAQVLLVGMKDRELVVPKTVSNVSNVSGVAGKLHFHDLQQQLNLENKHLEGQRFKLHEQLMMKDTQMDCLQKKVHVMQCQLAKVCQENKKLAGRIKEIEQPNNSSKRPQTCPCRDNNSEFYETDAMKLSNLKVSTSNIEKNFDHLSRMVDHLNCELESVKHERCILNGLSAPDQEFKCLQDLNQSLTEDCSKKDREIHNLRCKLCTLESSNGNQNVEKLDDYKIILMEMSSQLDHYKEKYVKSQQEVEESKLQLTKMELNNQKIEGQVNEEIKRIKCKFQEKLSELCPFPKKLAVTKDELMQANRKILKLEDDLKEACTTITKLKSDLKKLSPTGKGEDFSLKYKQALTELEQIKEYACELKCSKISTNKKYKSLLEEFEVLKSESAKIIANTKECGNTNKRILYSHIDKLEKDLAHCRASGSLTLNERENAIKQMKQQLNVLCANLSESKGQIESLKSHVHNLTAKQDERDFPDSQIDYCRY